MWKPTIQKSAVSGDRRALSGSRGQAASCRKKLWCADTLTLTLWILQEGLTLVCRYIYSCIGVWIQLEGFTLGRSTLNCVDNPPQAYSLRCGIHTVDTVPSSTQTKPAGRVTLRRSTTSFKLSTVWIHFLCATIHSQTKPSWQVLLLPHSMW